MAKTMKDRHVGNNYVDLLASDMSIDDAVLFTKAWMQENFNDQQSSIEIKRQPMDYKTEPPKNVVRVPFREPPKEGET